jgi:endonuclease/exonuclease/phosphatase family metal-dependent hydrolase
MRRCALVLLALIAGCSAGGGGAWPLKADAYASPDEAKHAPAVATLKVATYNLNHLENLAGLREDIARVDADVWFFQELRIAPQSDGEAPQSLRQLLPPGAWNVVIVRVNRLHETGDEQSDTEAQAIATRLPILRSEVWPLERGKDRSLRRRCALAVRAQIGGREVLLVNADLAPEYLAFEGDGRERYLKSLLHQLPAADDAPAIIGGDFNTCGNLWRFRSSRSDALVAHSFMSQAGFTPALDRADPTFSVGIIDGRLDDLYVRGCDATNAAVDHKSRGSDHRPLVCQVHLRDNETR